MDEERVIKFIRKKDLVLVKTLGQGACGETVLLRDDTINEKFVCKKYLPYDDEQKEELYKNFVQEIKILHLLYHKNIVRVFNHYLYPSQYQGFIVMEYVDGDDIEKYLGEHPENINDIFLQVIEGFSYLVPVAESTKNDKELTVQFRTRSASSSFSLNCLLTLFKKLKNQFSRQTTSNDTLQNSLFRLILPYNRVNKIRLWQKTAQPTLAA